MPRDTGPAFAPVLLIMGALLGGCSGGSEPVGNIAAAPPAVPKAVDPTERAQELVRADLGRGAAIRFAGAELFDSQGAAIVCGRFAADGQAEQRYIAVGGEDVFIESRMEAGEMDRAVAETCKSG